MYGVAPGLGQLHACSNFKTKTCSGGWNLVGISWSFYLLRTHCILDCCVASWPRVVWQILSGSYFGVKWTSWFWHQFWWSRRWWCRLRVRRLAPQNIFQLFLHFRAYATTLLLEWSLSATWQRLASSWRTEEPHGCSLLTLFVSHSSLIDDWKAVQEMMSRDGDADLHLNFDVLCSLHDIPDYLVVVLALGIHQAVCAEGRSFFRSPTGQMNFRAFFFS